MFRKKHHATQGGEEHLQFVQDNGLREVGMLKGRDQGDISKNLGDSSQKAISIERERQLR